MKSIDQNLYIRKSSYYYRSALPRELHKCLPYKEIILSLGSIELQRAKLKCAQIKWEEIECLTTFREALCNEEQTPDNMPQRTLSKLVQDLEDLKAKYSHRGKTTNLSLLNGEAVSPTFSLLKNTYLEECKMDAYDTWNQKIKSFECFLELIGDKPLAQISREDSRRFKSLLIKIPRNAKSKFKISNLSEIDWNKVDDNDLLHPNTINIRLMRLVTFFNWAIKQGYYHGENPFDGLMIKKSGKKTNSRRSYTYEEINKLFSSPVFQGSKGSVWRERLQSGPYVYKDSLYWIPLIALYSGMRLNEICQLYVSDIQYEQGIMIFDINQDGEDKTLKTSTSERKVPVHSELLNKEFEAFVTSQKEAGEKRLFPDIKMSCKNSYSYIFSKRFARLLKALNMNGNGLCFHSFRHTFIDELRNAGVERSIAMSLTGHHSSNDIHGNYGNGYNLTILQENLNKLTFPNIE